MVVGTGAARLPGRCTTARPHPGQRFSPVLALTVAAPDSERGIMPPEGNLGNPCAFEREVDGLVEAERCALRVRTMLKPRGAEIMYCAEPSITMAYQNVEADRAVSSQGSLWPIRWRCRRTEDCPCRRRGWPGYLA